MSELPYTYTDVDGATLHVEKGKVTANRRVESLVYLSAQDPEKVAALARAILAANGSTGYVLMSEADMVAQENAAAHSAAWSMRERAATWLEECGSAWEGTHVRDLPLLTDSDGADAASVSDAARNLSAIRDRANLDARVEADRLRLLEMVDHLRARHAEVHETSMDRGAKLARAEAKLRAVRDTAYDEGHADGLRMGTARADDKRLSDLEEQYTDLADLAEKLRADLGQAYAAVTGVGRLLRDHITAHQAHAAEVERRLTDLDGESP